MKTPKRKELSKRARGQEKTFWSMMRSADPGKLCFS